MRNPARILETALWAAIALATVYLVRKFQQTLETGAEALVTARSGVTNAIETFFPLVDPDSLITYAVTFPDGSRHAVLGESVSRGGYFTWNGARFRLLTNASGQKIAVSL